MSDWFLRLIGVQERIGAQVDRVQWLWSRPQWLIFGLLLIGPAAWFIVRRHRAALPHIGAKPRWALSVCRILVLLLLVIVLGGPYVRMDETIHQKPVLAWIIDESGSMDLPAGPFDATGLAALARETGMIEPNDKTGTLPNPSAEDRKKLNNTSRAQLLDAVLEHQKTAAFKSLDGRFDVRVYRVARQVREVTGDKSPKKLSEADAGETAIGTALNQAIDDAAGRTLAGIVVFSDGRSTSGPDVMSVIHRISGGLDRGSHAATPIVSVPVGSDEPAPDVAVEDVLAPTQATKGDTVSFVATIGSRRFDGRQVEVRLMRGEKTIDRAKVTLADAANVQASLSYTPDEVGEQMLRVTVDRQNEEPVKVNNTRAVRLRVDTDRQKVLYIEGNPRWDFRFLDHALRRDRGLDVRFVMESQLLADGTKPEDLPRAAKLPTDAAGFAEYGLVMLGDISPAMLPPTLQEALVKAVEDEGVGLIVQAGTEHMPIDFLDAPLGKLLPMKFEVRPSESEAGVMTAGAEAPAFAPFRMTVTPAGSLHPAFAIYPNATKNRQLWSQMPPFYWAASATQITPAATLLAEYETPQGKRPLIAEQFVGRGRVFMLNTDGTFRWRRNIGDVLFYRFWGQTVRHVTRSKQRSGSESWIEATPAEVEVGSEVSVELYAVGASGRPVDDAEIRLEITGETEGGAPPPRSSVTVRRTNQGGYYRGLWRAEQAGAFTVSYNDAKNRKVGAMVMVNESGRELIKPQVDRDALGTWADATGGSLIELGDVHELPDKLAGEAVTLHRPREREVWDNWLTLMLLVGLYCTDVGIRRLLGLT
ncbi:MAG: hypothetical protein GC162_03590 [Planctomycetes bacterium]|nr:hypothetical protein [Planctomycetota bacterium]